ncbi:MAG TPA: efflux RND transporter permease subunit, partial [Paludibacter sp.]|nr:efflux RND transporter permease subunit [Paludibacter sp.]
IESMPEIRKSTVHEGGGMSMMGGQSTIDVEVYGYDFDATDKVAKELLKQIPSIKGLVNTTISREEYTPEYQVDFDREKLALNGLNVAMASSFLSNRINGMTASLYREDGEEYSIVVAYDPKYRQSIEDVENIIIYNQMGQAVRVKDLGKVVERFTPPTIEHKNRQRIITVSSTVSGTTLDKAVAGINAQLAKMDIPSDINTKIAGSFKDQQESFADLGLLLLIIILLVFVVMASQFESVTYPFIIMFSVPFGVSGVVLALWMTGTTFNVMTFVGVIMLVGIVVKNGIVMVDYINLNRERGSGIIRAVVTGGKSRLRPVLMTSLTAILGMVPLAISHGQGSEMWKPMAVTVIGGLSVSTLLTLVVVPVIYTFFGAFGVINQYLKLNGAKKYFLLPRIITRYYTKEKSVPKLFSKWSIYILVLIFSLPVGAIALSVNLYRVNKKKVILPTMLGSFLYFITLVTLIYKFQQLAILGGILNMASYILLMLVWNKYIGKKRKFRPVSGWFTFLMVILLILMISMSFFFK